LRPIFYCVLKWDKPARTALVAVGKTGVQFSLSCSDRCPHQPVVAIPPARIAALLVMAVLPDHADCSTISTHRSVGSIQKKAKIGIQLYWLFDIVTTSKDCFSGKDKVVLAVATKGCFSDKDNVVLAATNSPITLRKWSFQASNNYSYKQCLHR
jgi:hypothetical protein